MTRLRARTGVGSMTGVPRGFAALATAVLVLASVHVPAVAAAFATFETPTAQATYGEQVSFEQPVDLQTIPDKVEVLIEYPGALGPAVTEVRSPSAAGRQTLRYTLELADGHILPNTRLTARWRLTFNDETQTSPAVSVLYADTRFDWQTRTGSLVRIHWYQGGDAFGRRALDIAEKGVQQAEDLLGVKESEPIDFFVYASQAPFYDALGPGTRENVGGEAHAEIRTMFALITPDEIDAAWVEIVLPHELTHLVFNTAVKNPYHFPPRWLNEGIAVYLSEGYGSDNRTLIQGAASQGAIMPLDGLTGQFPTTADRFYLAYAESVSAVDYLVKTYGRDALVSLVRSYADGVTDDEAFKASLGVGVDDFSAAWLSSIKAQTPKRYGPQPAPAGPLPPGWSGSPAPGTSPVPNAPGPTATPVATPAGTPGPAADSTLPTALLLVVGLMALVIIGGGAYLYRSSRPRP